MIASTSTTGNAPCAIEDPGELHCSCLTIIEAASHRETSTTVKSEKSVIQKFFA